MGCYDAGVFVDPRHLDRDGATTLSVEIARVLERRRCGISCPSWVALPAYRPVPLEELDAGAGETGMAGVDSPGR